MAKDDYDKIVYQVLLYLYAALKREVLFDLDEFKKSAKSNVSSDEYFSELNDPPELVHRSTKNC